MLMCHCTASRIGGMVKGSSRMTSGWFWITCNAMRRHQACEDREYGYDLGPITTAGGQVLHTQLNDTMLRVDLPTPL